MTNHRSMPEGRQLHVFIRSRIEKALKGRTWTWLAETASVPQSTLASQVGKPRFSVDVLVKVATALDVNLGDLFPIPSDTSDPDAETD